MGYVEKSLADDEIIVLKAKFHWTVHLAAWAALLFLGVALVGIYIFLRLIIWIWTTEIAVTDRRLLVKRGWLTRKTEELSLSSVEELNIVQGFWGRLLDFGKLIIAGTGAGEIITPPIADPVGFRRAVSQARTRFLPPKTRENQNR